MLDVSLHGVSAGILHDLSIAFPRMRFTAIVGPPACGASTLLRVLAGQRRVQSGVIRIGARDVTRLAAARRPLLYVTSKVEAPARWSVRHLLVAALRHRNLDRHDRYREYELAIAKWNLADLAGRALGTLSSSERTAAQLARIELLRPAILIADRLLERLSFSAMSMAADEFYRTLRVIGTTVISAPSSIAELGFTDGVVVLDRGGVVQEDSWAEIYRHPRSAAAAIGEVNVIPISIHDGTVQAAIGSWGVTESPFEGDGIALARPEDFHLAVGGESDLILGIEEASFREGRWLVTGVLTGGIKLRVWLAGDFAVEKGRLLPLRFDPARFALVKSGVRHLQLPSWFGSV